MTAGGRAGHGSGADLSPFFLGKNMPKARAGGAEEARPESAERKGPGRPRAGGVSSARAWAGGRSGASGCRALLPPSASTRGASQPVCGLSRGAAGLGASGFGGQLGSFRNRFPVSGTGLFPRLPVPCRRRGAVPGLSASSREPAPALPPRPAALLEAVGRTLMVTYDPARIIAAIKSNPRAPQQPFPCSAVPRKSPLEGLEPGTDKDVAAASR